VSPDHYQAGCGSRSKDAYCNDIAYLKVVALLAALLLAAGPLPPRPRGDPRALGSARQDQPPGHHAVRALPLPAHARGRCRLVEDARRLPRRAGRQPAVLPRVGHRGIRGLAARIWTTRSSAGASSPYSRSTAATSSGSPMRLQFAHRPAGRGARFHGGRRVHVRPHGRALAGHHGRTRRPLAKAGQERRARPDAHRKDWEETSEDPARPLRAGTEATGAR
jgi:hypothetical protein